MKMLMLKLHFMVCNLILPVVFSAITMHTQVYILMTWMSVCSRLSSSMLLSTTPRLAPVCVTCSMFPSNEVVEILAISRILRLSPIFPTTRMC